MTTNIVTIYKDPNDCLTKKATKIPLTKKGLDQAKEIGDKLRQAVMPLMPVSGLAAPQIGISKQVFLYSFNGSQENIEIIVNPSFKILDQNTNWFWEGCFSTVQNEGICELANVARYNKILASYNNLEGKTLKKILEGYTARIFQHEYDHLQGIVAVNKPGSEVKTFDNKGELLAFLKNFKETNIIKIEHIPPKDAQLIGT
jgi:peptide deformylase